MLKVSFSKLALPWSNSSTTPGSSANAGDKHGDSGAAPEGKGTTISDPPATPRGQLQPSASRRYYSHGGASGGDGGGRSGGTTASGGGPHPKQSDADEARDATSGAFINSSSLGTGSGSGNGASQHQQQNSNASTSSGVARTPRGLPKHSTADTTSADFPPPGGASGRDLSGGGAGGSSTSNSASTPRAGHGGRGGSAAGGGSGFGLVVTQRTARVVSADEEACWAVGMEREELLRASLFDLAEKLNPAEWVRAVEGMSAKDRPRVIVRFRLVQPSNHRGGNGGGSGALSGRRVDCELQELVPNSKAMRVHIAPIPPNSPGGGGGGGGGEKPVAPTTPRAGLSHSKTLSRAETMSSQQAPSLSHSHTLAHSPSSLGGKQGASRVTFGGEHGGRGGGGSDVGDYGGQARERERGRRGAAEAGAAHGGKLVPGERGAPVAALRGRAQAEGEVQGEREGEAGRQCQNWKRAAAGLNEGEAEAGGRLRVGAWRG
ncbi:unnamed protein product [Closterium sp. NIES-64]|nr:unnamed protein product [Closterium sp. NIES-64]